MTRCDHGVPWLSHLMSESHRQHRTGILLVIAAAIAWSTAPLFTRLLHFDSWTILFWRGLFGGGFIAALTVAIRRHKETSMVAAAAMSNFLGSLVSIPFAQDIAAVGPIDLALLAMFGLLQVGLGLTLFALGSRLLPSRHASLIATLETPLMPFWVWLAFAEVPALRALAGGALVMGAVLADIVGDDRAKPEAAQAEQ